MIDMLFIADFFADQVPGGGELNNDVLINRLVARGHKVRRLNSHLVSEQDIISSEAIIVSNFVNLSEKNKEMLQNKNYIIYEHDHKYLPSRNPAAYANYKAPKDQIINRKFYMNASMVLCQSKFHFDIIKRNLELENILSLGGNLWTEQQFASLEKLSSSPKTDTYAIMDSPIAHKNTHEAVQYCETLGLDYNLISPAPPTVFLRNLGAHSTFVFFPKTPETLSRVVVEARMMGMKTKTTNNIGAIHEQWFNKKGLDLIDYMRYKQGEIENNVLESLNV